MEELSVTQMLMQGQKDLLWFHANKEKFISQYNNKFIAFQNERIIDADPHLERLIGKIKEKGIDLSTVLIEFVSKVKFIL